MFAVKAGAAKVVGVDCSDIIDQARHIVAANGFADSITLVKGKMEEVRDGPSRILHAEWIPALTFIQNDHRCHCLWRKLM